MTVREQTCCFTGHRTLPAEALPQLRQNLEAILRDLIAKGFRYFETGGALGFDTMAAEMVLSLRETNPSVHLILVLPCRDQTKRWKAGDVARYEAIKIQADKVVYTGERYTAGCMHRRNRRLVDDSAVLIAYCTRATGGSAYTVAYAERKDVPVIRVEDGATDAAPMDALS